MVFGGCHTDRSVKEDKMDFNSLKQSAGSASASAYKALPVGEKMTGTIVSVKKKAGTPDYAEMLIDLGAEYGIRARFCTVGDDAKFTESAIATHMNQTLPKGQKIDLIQVEAMAVSVGLDELVNDLAYYVGKRVQFTIGPNSSKPAFPYFNYPVILKD
jgi:hypothetical protein